MRLFFIAKLYGKSFKFGAASEKHLGKVIAALTNVEFLADSNLETSYSLDMEVGYNGTSNFQFCPLLTHRQTIEEPNFIDADRSVLFYSGSLFLFDPPPISESEIEKAVLLAKKHVLSEHVSVTRLRAEVAALEAIATRGKLPSRPPIPDAVKHAVWIRDQGACIACGSQKELQFDHIIPYSKGGSDSIQNLQILCGPCNRSKSDQI